MRNRWTEEELAKEALKYDSKISFKTLSNSAYQTASRLGILRSICSHMKQNTRWTSESLAVEAAKYYTKSEFAYLSNSAYLTAQRRGLLNAICSHMPNHADQSGPNNPRYHWTLDKLKEEASKYSSRGDFQSNHPSAYMAALRNGTLNEICAHMSRSSGISKAESELSNAVRHVYPDAIKIRDTTVKIKNKPFIKGFELDIYVPSVNKAIEFDGTYWHSQEGLKRSRANWAEEDLVMYHKIKDEYFASKGILILHITEQEWLENKEICINKSIAFLRGDE